MSSDDKMEVDSESITNDNVASINDCLPFKVILDRLPKETFEYYAKRTDPPLIVEPDDDNENVIGDDEDDEDDDEDKESKIVTIDLNNIGQSNLNISSMVGNYKSSRMKCDDKIFCLFNLEEFDDQYEAVQSFYRELRYAPFRCIECDEATIELKGMVEHYLNVHPDIKKAQYWIEQVASKEKWVHKFINYQIDCANEEDEMFPNDIVNKYCPVCNHYDYLTRGTESKPHLKVSTILDMNHINKHLRYNPWECVLCRKNGRRYAISSVNKKAQDHLADRHNIKSDGTDGKNYFKATATIPELDNFLREYIIIIKGNDRQMTKPVVRRKPLAGKPIRQNTGKGRGKQTGQLYKQATASYKRLRESRDSGGRPAKKANRKVIPFKEEDIEDGPILKDDNSTKFCCIFCSDDHNLSDIYLAWGHYANHLKYTPIICGICNKTFTSDNSFRYHGIEHVEHSDLPFTRNCDEAIETWGHEFLEGLTKDSEAKPEFASFCPVCEKIFSKPIEIPHVPANTVRSHVYSHLKYYPYECIPCSGQFEKKTFVGDLDYQAALHLNTAHAITVTPLEIPNYFIKSRGIESVDDLLKKHFSNINYLIGAPTELTAPPQPPLPQPPVC